MNELLPVLDSFEKNTRPLPQITNEVSFKTDYFKLTFQDSIDVSDGDYIMGVTSFNTYNSIFIVNSKNNKTVYHDGVEWREIIFPYGAYEIEQINDEVSRQLSLKLEFEESPIIIEANTATLHSIIHLSDNYKIDFTQPNTLRNLLGFEPKIISNTFNYSKNKVNIIDIHRIHLCCDCIVGSLQNGQPSNISFTIILNEVPGAKIVREPNLVLYKHIYKDKIDNIGFWFEDNNGNRVEMHGESIEFTLHMKKNS